MRRVLLFLMASVFLTASTALSQDVRYNFDRDTDFSRFKTYKWVSSKMPHGLTIWSRDRLWLRWTHSWQLKG